MSSAATAALRAVAKTLIAETPDPLTRDRIIGFLSRALSITGAVAEEHALAHFQALPWQPFRPGVEIISLGTSPEGATAALLRYVADGAVPRHIHPGNEYILILEGSQADERGAYPRGSVVHNAPGSSHSVTSSSGCVVAIIWEKPIVFVQDDLL